MNKKPWYIWLSFVGLAFLWGDTARKVKFFSRDLDLWLRAVGNIAKIFFVYMMLPIITSAFLINVFIMDSIQEGDALHDFLPFLILIVIYVGGVIATYKHVQWRNEHLNKDLKDNQSNQGNKTIFKKRIVIIFMALLFISILSAGSNLLRRAPLDYQNFLNVMEEKGFIVIDYTNYIPEELSDRIYLYLIALAPNNSYQINFVQLNTVSYARSSFTNTMRNANRLRGNITSYRSISVSNHRSFQLTSAGLYSQLLQVDNVLIYVVGADADYRSEIRTIMNLIS